MQVRKFQFTALVGAITLAAASANLAQSQPAQVTRVANLPTVSYLGVATQDVNMERAKALKLPAESGIEITLLDSESPAAAAGLKVGDVVSQYNGQNVEGKDQFQRLVRETTPGKEVRLKVYRDGVAQTIAVKIGSSPAITVRGQLVPAVPYVPPMPGTLPDVPSNRMSWRIGLGAEVESLDGQMADYFGVKEGLLVRSVTKGSMADRAGLRAGDVITRVGDAKVATPADLSARIRAGREQSAAMTVVRDHKEMTLTVGLIVP